METTLRHRVVIVLAMMGFGFAMAMRAELSSFVGRFLLAGVAGGLGGIALSQVVRRPDHR